MTRLDENELRQRARATARDYQRGYEDGLRDGQLRPLVLMERAVYTGGDPLRTLAQLVREDDEATR